VVSNYCWTLLLVTSLNVMFHSVFQHLVFLTVSLLLPVYSSPHYSNSFNSSFQEVSFILYLIMYNALTKNHSARKEPDYSSFSPHLLLCDLRHFPCYKVSAFIYAYLFHARMRLFSYRMCVYEICFACNIS
jgi:hypothetical protein